MERPSSIAIPIKTPLEETSTSTNIHLVHKCCDSQRSRYDINNFANDAMKQKHRFTSKCLLNMASISTDDVFFSEPEKGSISKSINPLSGNANALYNMDRHEIAAIIVEQILDKALDCIFRKKDSTKYSQEECMKADTYKCFCNAEGIETCLKSPNDFQLCSVYPEGDGLVSFSSFKSPSHDNNCHLVLEELQSSDLERNIVKMGSIKKTNLINLEKDNVSNSSVSNKANESMVFCVNSTSEKCEGINKLDFSILRDMLSGGDYFPPYLPNERALKNIFSIDNREMKIALPKCDEQAASNLQLLTKTTVNNTFRQTLIEVNNTFLGRSNTALTSEKTFTVSKELCDISPGNSSCNVKKVTARLEFADSVTNDFDNIIQRKTNSEEKVIKTNKLTLAVKSVPVKVQMNHSNMISTFVSDSSRTVSLLGDKLDALESNFTQSDQTVPIEINSVMKNVFETSRYGSVKTVTERTNAPRDMSVPHSIFKSSELNKTRISDHIASLSNDYSTNDCDEIVSLDLLQMFTVKCTKTVIEQNFEFCNSNNIVPCKLHINKINNVVNHQGNGNSTIVRITEVKTLNPVPTVCGPILKNSSIKVQSNTLNPVPTVCGPILKNSSIKVQSNTDVNSNEQAHKPCNFDYNDLFEISSSSWSDIDHIKEGVDVAEKTLDKVVEEMVLIHLPLLNEGSDDHFAANSDDCDIDELDRVIDDSIKKYEQCTVDASILETPSTTEKSCQTEDIEFQNIARCKRCLEFEDQPSEPIKKKKLNSNEKSYFDLPGTSDCHIGFNNSPAPSTGNNNTHNGSKILPSPTERVQFGHFSSLVNNEDLLTTISSERFQKSNSLVTDEVHELDDEESLFDAEDNEELNQMDWSNESSYDSEQEVPINPQANEDMDGDDEATDSSSETEYFEALEGLRNARKL